MDLLDDYRSSAGVDELIKTVLNISFFHTVGCHHAVGTWKWEQGVRVKSTWSQQC
jgi:hypothetical protein